MNGSRAAIAGLIGAAVMTALLLIEPSVGLPKIAMGEVLSTALGLGSAHLATGPALGWLLHFIVGIVLALIYARYFDQRLPGSPLTRGLLYGVLVFLVAHWCSCRWSAAVCSRTATSSFSPAVSSVTLSTVA